MGLKDSKDQSILIIGATSEIGSHIAKTLSGNKTQLTLVGRDKNKLDELQSTLNENYLKTISIDYLKTKKDYENLFTSEEFDGVVLLTPRPGSNKNSTPDRKEWEDLFNNCFIGPLDILRQAIDHLKPLSKILIISGITSKQYYPALPQYAVIRSMWLAEAKALSIQLGAKKISVNTLSLGGVWTDALTKKIEAESKTSNKSVEEIRKDRISNIPLSDYADLSEISYAVNQLLGDFANHISGQNIALDGGFTSSY